MSSVIWAVYDSEMKQVYHGHDSKEAEARAKKEGINHLRSYHLVGSVVCVNDDVYKNGKEIEHTLRYISEEEINILNEALRGK